MTILWGVLAALLSGASAFASEPGPLGITPGEHAACDGDASRLCAGSALDQAQLVGLHESQTGPAQPGLLCRGRGWFEKAAHGPVSLVGAPKGHVGVPPGPACGSRLPRLQP